jgi:hypothetical protein
MFGFLRVCRLTFGVRFWFIKAAPPHVFLSGGPFTSCWRPAGEENQSRQTDLEAGAGSDASRDRFPGTGCLGGGGKPERSDVHKGGRPIEAVGGVATGRGAHVVALWFDNYIFRNNLAWLLRNQRRAGTEGEVIFVPDVSQIWIVSNLLKRKRVARMSEAGGADFEKGGLRNVILSLR